MRLWDHTVVRPVMTFDLNNSVGDIAWAPYSATTFAAVTADGKVPVFDLGENKYEPLCEPLPLPARTRRTARGKECVEKSST